MNKKKLLIFISILVVIILVVSTILIITNYNKSTKFQYKEVYGVVLEKHNDSFRIKETMTNNESTYLYDDLKYNDGDLVLIKVKNGEVQSVELIYENNTTNPVIIVDDITTTTTQEITTTQPTTRVTTKTNVNNTTTKPASDEDVETYFSTLNTQISSSNDNSPSFKEKAKSSFISLVDFIFYGGTIKGKTFAELKDSTKAKVIYYALLVDNKIDSKFPNYKETLSDKYKDAKGKLVAKYLDLKYDICEKVPEGCKQASDDFKLLKYSLGLTWDMVKSFFGYVKDLTLPKIQSWYESFKG